MIRNGLRLGGKSVMVISWRPSNEGIAVLTSMMIFGFSVFAIANLSGPTYLVGHLDQFWRCSYRCTWDNAAFLRDGRGFDDNNIKLLVWLVLGVIALKSSVMFQFCIEYLHKPGPRETC